MTIFNTIYELPEWYFKPWIYHNSADGLISLSSDWINWITISDKNLWATTVWNSWDTLSEANCGKYYQRWNNYWFPRTWSVTTSSTQVNASNYWPWNYYSSSTFIKYSWRWDTTDNRNLRWWNTWTVEATQWPSPSGFHVPLTTEWQAVKDIRTALGGWSTDWTNFWIALKLPFAGRRLYSSANVSSQGTGGSYWSPSCINATDAYYISIKSTTLTPKSNTYRTSGLSIRCFKNSPVTPTSSWTKLY